MTSQPPPLQNQSEPQPSTNKGCKWLAIIAAVISLLLVIVIGAGIWFFLPYVLKNQERVRQTVNTIQPAQMQPDFLELLNAINSTLDEPSSAQAIGKVDQQGSDPYIDKAKLLLKEKKYKELNKLLSDCYKGKLMTKEGFFIYRRIIHDLVESKGVAGWVRSTGSSHAHIVAGLKERKWAWKARGSGYSNTVTEAGWRGFRMHLKLATEHYQQAVKEDKNNSVALGMLVTIGLGRGQLEGILPEIVKMGLERTPEDGMLAARISYYLTPRWHGSREQVIGFVRDELPKWPNSGGKFNCLLDRMSLASEWGNSKFLMSSPEALAVYEKVVVRYKQQWPEGGYVVKEIAKHLTTYKSYTAAVAFCRKHEQEFSSKAEYNFILGKALYSSKKYAESQALLQEAVRLGKVDGETYYYLGLAAEYAKDYPVARTGYLKAIELLPSTEHWRRGRSYQGVAMYYSVFSDYKSVKTYAAKSAKADPSRAHSWYLLGFAEYKLGNKKAAKIEFNKAVKLDSKYGAIIRKECPFWKMW